MSLATGAKSALRFKEESVYGTPPTGNYEELSFNTEAIQSSVNTIISNEVKRNRAVGSIRGGNIAAGGDITMDLYISKLGLLLKHLTGTAPATTTVTVNALATGAITRGTYVSSNSKIYVALNDGTIAAVGGGLTATQNAIETLDGVDFQHVAASAATIYQHLLVGGIDLPAGGLTFEKLVGGSTADTYFTYVGGRLNTFNINIPQEGIVGVTMGFLALKALTASTTSIAGTPVSVGDDPATGFECQLKINGVAQTIAQAATLNFSNNLDANAFVIGSRYRKDIPTGRREVTGTITMFFENLTAYNLFLNETVVPIEFNFITNGLLFSIDMPECKLTGGSPSPQIAGNGTITQQFNFQAFRDSGAHDVRFTMKNLTASYA